MAVRNLNSVSVMPFNRELKIFASLVAIFATLVGSRMFGAEGSGFTNQFISHRALPLLVHVFEDFETDIEMRWWLRGAAETNNLPPSLSPTLSNTRACRATATKDFDDKFGDASQNYKAVVFNPVPGPPMGAH